MRTLAQTSPRHNEEQPAKGQNVDEVYSEITEILKFERVQDAANDVVDRIDNKGELIKKYIRAIHNTAITKHWPDDDKRMIRTKMLEREYQALNKEEIVVLPTVLFERHHHIMMIDSDESTRKIVPDEQYQVTYTALENTVLLRWLSRLSKIACQLADILAAEIDLHKDFTDRKMTPDKLARGFEQHDI